MKTFELKKKSWHYWIANFGEERVYESTDICSYIRYVIKGGLLFLLVASVGIFLGGSLLFSIGNLFGWLFLGYELEKVTFTTFSVIILFGALIGFFLGKEAIEQSEPGFVRLAYRSWKDKFCAKVELK